MTDTIKRLAKGSVTTSEVVVYTVPATPTTKTVVRHVTIANTAANTRAVTLKMAAVEILPNRSISAGEQVEWDTGHDLEAGETITIQGSDTGLTYYITGVEIV